MGIHVYIYVDVFVYMEGGFGFICGYGYGYGYGHGHGLMCGHVQLYVSTWFVVYMHMCVPVFVRVFECMCISLCVCVCFLYAYYLMVLGVKSIIVQSMWCAYHRSYAMRRFKTQTMIDKTTEFCVCMPLAL